MTRPWPILPLLVSLGLHGVALAVAVLAAKHHPLLAPTLERPVFQVTIAPPPPTRTAPQTTPKTQTTPPPTAAPVAHSVPSPRQRPHIIPAPGPIPAAASTSPSIATPSDGADAQAPSAPQPLASPAATLVPPGYLLGDSRTPMPDYPWSARRRGVEGRVVLRLEVDRDGRPVGVRILASSGDAALDNAALSAVRDWRLSPARQGEQNVAGDVDVPIVFRLI